MFVDEIQELFLFGKIGKDRRGDRGEVHQAVPRAGHHRCIIGTQIPDKDSLPTGITRNINTRFCLSRR